MRVGPFRTVAQVVVATVALAGCASTAGLDAEPAGPGADRDLASLEEAYWARQEAAQSRYTEADVQFMIGMIGHHAQALVMSAMAPANGASPAVQRLAARIDNAQRDEIASMQRWLDDRGQPVPQVEIEGTVLTIEMPMDGMDHAGMDHSTMDHGGGHDHMSMPGMLTQAQLDELNEARGAAFDRLFLTYMIQHHGGAVTMVDALFATDGAGQDEQAFKFANDVQVDQRTEIARMQRMLDSLSDS